MYLSSHFVSPHGIKDTSCCSDPGVHPPLAWSHFRLLQRKFSMVIFVSPHPAHPRFILTANEPLPGCPALLHTAHTTTSSWGFLWNISKATAGKLLTKVWRDVSLHIVCSSRPRTKYSWPKWMLFSSLNWPLMHSNFLKGRIGAVPPYAQRMPCIRAFPSWHSAAGLQWSTPSLELSLHSPVQMAAQGKCCYVRMY